MHPSTCSLFSCTAPPPTETYTLSLHDALPIWPLAAPGKEMENGIELFLQQQKNTLAGRRVELTVVDSGGQPAGTLARARELVEQRKVHVIIGPLAAFEAYALAPYVNAQRIPTISPSAAADDLTQRKATQFFVR